jgi:hypothetical protein
VPPTYSALSRLFPEDQQLTLRIRVFRVVHAREDMGGARKIRAKTDEAGIED